MSREPLVYDIMRTLVERTTVVDDVHAVDEDGQPALPKLPVFVPGNDPEEWACRWYHVEPWSPIMSEDPLVREDMVVKCVVFTREDVFGDVVR